ncbi:MAG: peptidoglycan DD-metalloendopeptidase family protein, partial [Pseudomonadota bacterium]
AGRVRQHSAASETAQRELVALDEQALEVAERMEQHRSTLYQQINVAYKSSRTPRVQMLLNQQDPAQLSRMLTYYDRFNKARQRHIKIAIELLDELDTVRRDQRTTAERLEQSLTKLESEQQALINRRKQRKATLVGIEKKLGNDQQRLAKLQVDQRELEELMQQLSEILAEIPPPPLERKPFKSMRGKLPWPAVGTLRAKYNSLKGTANLRWKGMFIGAKLGNNVRAIYHGRVAFANWMNGFGLILIIDHGDGYMSIYANCQELHKTQGEWVVPGDLIATVGDSGGQKTSGVYFEMRSQGEPINPHRWVKKSIKFVAVQ